MRIRRSDPPSFSRGSVMSASEYSPRYIKERICSCENSLPCSLRELVRRMAHDNPTCGEDRIAHELSVKLGIRVSPRTAPRILHTNVTAHPTAEWTIQQFREFMAFDQPYRFVIHDRDAIFAARLDSQSRDFGVRVMKMPVRAPTANAYCEGTIRRERLDFLIPLSETHPQANPPQVRPALQSGKPRQLNDTSNYCGAHVPKCTSEALKPNCRK